MLAACKAQPDAAGNNSAASQNMATRPAPRSLPSDKELRAMLVASWVTSDERPEGDPEDICATDNGIILEADGGYASYSEGGRWDVKDGTLIITSTTTFPDDEEDNASETPIDPPRIARWQIEEISGNLIRTRAAGASSWMFRCPLPPKD